MTLPALSRVQQSHGYTILRQNTPRLTQRVHISGRDMHWLLTTTASINTATETSARGKTGMGQPGKLFLCSCRHPLCKWL